LRINGRKVGNRILDPAWTDYSKIALYSTYDVTEHIKEKNAISVILGNSRHIINYRYKFLKLILQIEICFSDDTSTKILSDNSWKVSQGPILENGIYFGEKYDARLESLEWDNPGFDDSTWDNVVEINGPSLSSQLIQPIRITEKIKPIKVYSPEFGIYIYDFGQNFTGFVRLKAQGPKSTQITLRFAETIFEDGTINVSTNGTAKANDIFILKGEGEEVFEPHFTYHGFRYVEITGFPGVPTLDTLVGLFFHSDVKKTGNFYCSNNLINQIHTNIIWGQLSNLMSIPTDCPQRDERQGWLGDAQLLVEETIYNFDIARFYSKYLRDIKLSQREDGRLCDVVPPYWPFYPADPAWGTAYITIVWYLYWYYNDIEIIKEHYDSMKLYIDFLSSMAKDNILYMGKFGDWCSPNNIVSRKTPIEFTSTWYYYHDVLHLSKLAKIIGKNNDFEKLLSKANEIKDAFNQKFLKSVYDIIKHSTVDRTIGQTLNVLPLYLKMVPENKERKVVSTLIEAIKEEFDYHVDTGIIGTRYLFDVLTEYGYPEVAYKMITQKSFPGYGYMISEGSTTLWERWEKLEGHGMNSQNHIMLGSVDTYFYKALAGIKSTDSGWKRLKIKPFIAGDIKYATATLMTIRGKIHVSWEKKREILNLKIRIPVGTSAKIWIPIENTESIIKEGESVIWEEDVLKSLMSNVEFIEKVENHVVFNVGSGFYQFSVLYSVK